MPEPRIERSLQYQYSLSQPGGATIGVELACKPLTPSVPTLKDLDVAGQIRCYSRPPIESRNVSGQTINEIVYRPLILSEIHQSFGYLIEVGSFR